MAGSALRRLMAEYKRNIFPFYNYHLLAFLLKICAINFIIPSFVLTGTF